MTTGSLKNKRGNKKFLEFKETEDSLPKFMGYNKGRARRKVYESLHQTTPNISNK
jgi:hypothetical protein